MAAQNRQDMGSGPVKSLLLQLMIPAVVAQVVNLLYNIVDRIYIGHIEGIGAAALTGVGLFAPILMLLNAFAMLIGAGKKARVKEAFRFQFILCVGYTTLFWLLMMAVPGVVAGIFTSDAALIDYTTWAMRIYMAGILAMGVQVACQQSFMALGQAKVSLLLACLRKIILLIPLIFILPHFVADKCFGVFLAEPVSDLLAATITAITFFSRFDKILDRGAGRA